ncbi:coatomer subunit delta-like protein isoform X2, partial [Tanacetum coccineum]
NCRTSLYGNELQVRIEYNASEGLLLEDVVISVHLPTINEALNVELVHGEWRYDSEKSVLKWSMPLIDDSKPSGAMEFFICEAHDVSKFFPVYVEFKSTTTFSNLKIRPKPVIMRVIPYRICTNADLMKVGGYKFSALEIEAILLEMKLMEKMCATVVPDVEIKKAHDIWVCKPDVTLF